MDLKLYTIRLLKKEEYGDAIDFIRKYWSERHVFCRNKEIFEFQHGDAASGEYDFIVAVHNETGEIHATLGYISSSIYDGGSKENPESVAGVLWKVRDDVKNKEIGSLGLGVLFYLMKKFPDSAYLALGLSEYSQKIYKALHFNFATMAHYYIASKYTPEFHIVDKPYVNKESKCNPDYDVRIIESIPDNFESAYYPRKSSEYIRRRYIEHLFYKYQLCGIYKDEVLKCVWVIRPTDVEGSRVIRLVDMVGDLSEVKNIEGNVHELLKALNAEAIDCYNYGIDSKVFADAGFASVSGDTIVPNYYEPFLRENVDMHCASYAKKPVVMFKGDSDQDRPNLLEQQ